MMKGRTEILDSVVAILSAEFGLPAASITPQVNLYEELGLDSIDAVDMFVRLQELVGHKIHPDTFKRVRTVDDVVSAIDDLVNAA